MNTKNAVSTYTNNAVYKKANSLIMSWSSMPLMTNKLFMLGIMQAVEQANGTYVTVIPGKMLKTLFGDNSGSFYTRVRNACHNPDNPNDPNTLMKYTAFFENEEKQEFMALNLVIKAGFQDNKLVIAFNPEASKYLFELKNRYTELNADVMIMLNNPYTWRMFEIFQKHIGLVNYEYKKGKRSEKNPYVLTIGITRLKLSLGIIDVNNPEVIKLVNKNRNLTKNINDDDNLMFYDPELEKLCTLQSYIRFNNFRTRVLETAQQEMDEKTSLSFKYEPKSLSGKGNVVSHIVFYIYDRSAEKREDKEIINEPEIDIDELIDRVRDIIEENLPTKDIRAILRAADNDTGRIEETYKIACQKPRNNLTGFMIAALENNYTNHSSKGRGGFCDMMERQDYDFSELEKVLVDN